MGKNTCLAPRRDTLLPTVGRGNRPLPATAAVRSPVTQWDVRRRRRRAPTRRGDNAASLAVRARAWILRLLSNKPSTIVVSRWQGRSRVFFLCRSSKQKTRLTFTGFCCCCLFFGPSNRRYVVVFMVHRHRFNVKSGVFFFISFCRKIFSPICEIYLGIILWPMGTSTTGTSLTTILQYYHRI